MNITAAWVTGATVTVYFIGLVHFSDVQNTGDAYVPLATSTSTTHRTLTLLPHRADIRISGFDGTTALCTSVLTGTYTPATGTTPAVCEIANLNGKDIEFPNSSSATALTLTNFDIPHLKTPLCPTIGQLTGANYAATLKLREGTLTACKDGQAWVSYLTIPDAANDFTIDGTTVALSTNGAIVEVLSEPDPPDTDTSGGGKRHFWWYYKMYTNNGSCQQLPAITTATVSCPPGFPHVHPYATGVGCSNSQYP